jgi:hypothetical protein
MIISSEIENVEKVGNLTKKIKKSEKHFKSFSLGRELKTCEVVHRLLQFFFQPTDGHLMA